MSDDEKNQNDPCDRDNEFFPDGGLIKVGELNGSKLLAVPGVSRLRSISESSEALIHLAIISTNVPAPCWQRAVRKAH